MKDTFPWDCVRVIVMKIVTAKMVWFAFNEMVEKEFRDAMAMTIPAMTIASTGKDQPHKLQLQPHRQNLPLALIS